MTNELKKVDFNHLPDLAKATTDVADLCTSYWTPSVVGESKRVFFVDLTVESVTSLNEPNETIELPVVVFAEVVNGTARAISNGGRRLYSVFENLLTKDVLAQGDAFEITFLGKQKNKNNAYMSDSWSVKRLIL